MKVKVYSKDTEEVRTLRLQDLHDDTGVRLVVVDENGERVPSGTLLHINNHGVITVSAGVDAKLGFGTQLKVVKE